MTAGTHARRESAVAPPAQRPPEPPARPDPVAVARLAWRQMPVLTGLRRQLRADRSFRDLPIALAMHISLETAHLAITLRDAGARLLLHPSNPGTLNPDALAVLTRRGIRVETLDDTALAERLTAFGPRLLVDNGRLLTICAGAADLAGGLIGATVHSRNAERVVRELLDAGAKLPVPVIPVADSALKSAVETPAGTGQSAVHALVRATGVQLSGKRAVVIGYGTAGTGIARYLDAMRCRVTVVDSSALACLRALTAGHDIDVLDNALGYADIVVVATGTRRVLSQQQVDLLRDGVLLGNIGHYPDAIDVPELRRLADKITTVGDGVDEYVIAGRSLYLLGDGNQFNHVCGDGNSSETMDLTLALHVHGLLHLLSAPRDLEPGLNPLPARFTESVARAKLRALGHVA